MSENRVANIVVSLERFMAIAMVVLLFIQKAAYCI